MGYLITYWVKDGDNWKYECRPITEQQFKFLKSNDIEKITEYPTGNLVYNFGVIKTKEKPIKYQAKPPYWRELEKRGLK
jgi:hypothetical protein